MITTLRRIIRLGCIDRTPLLPAQEKISEREILRTKKRKGFCKRGHAQNDKNSYLTAAGTRQCKICKDLKRKMRLQKSNPEFLTDSPGKTYWWE